MNKKNKRESITSETAGTSYIKCPFFKAHNNMEIHCEGLIDGCRNCTRFRKTANKIFHQKTFCENQYKRCEVYLSIRHWKWPEE